VLPAAVQNDTRYGIDVSHRGGLPGFIAVIDDRTLLLPDYAGTFLTRYYQSLVPSVVIDYI